MMIVKVAKKHPAITVVALAALAAAIVFDPFTGERREWTRRFF